MDTCEALHIRIHDRVSLGGPRVAKVFLAWHTIHHIGPGSIDPAVYPRHWDSALVKHLLQPHFMLEREANPRIEPFAPHIKGKSLAGAIELHEPGRAPARLAFDSQDPTFHLRLDPLHDALVLVALLRRVCHRKKLNSDSPAAKTI